MTTCADEKPIPTTFGVLLFPGFQALDVFGPIDVLNTLALSKKLNLHIIAETLDPVTTKLPQPNTTGSEFHECIVPTHTFATVPPLDFLLVPGGLGTRAPGLDPTRQFVKNIYPSLKYLMTVCTGSALIAPTGLLDGRSATGNKKLWAWVTSQGPKVNWVAQARWVVDGNIWTSSGIAAGMDAMYAFVKYIWGEEQSKDLAMSLEYERHTDPHWDPFAEYWGATWPLTPGAGSGDGSAGGGD
ncbi:class I glutamine amidotransferase-like protein [Tuber borchii]|uniref:Class I glutamine amidotransferase-like protein n=1 Tax=Tuber borchii TaxID=42251 RepID=A0A2T6ZCP3_TUBBO|nr:class I glutamine amidotransferase-like protein [Tuber borchii]